MKKQKLPFGGVFESEKIEQNYAGTGIIVDAGGYIKKLVKHIKSKAGYTLMEIVIVLGILGILISGVLPIFLNSIEANLSSAYYSRAYKILDSKMETYRNADFNTLTTGTESTTDLPSGQIVLTVSNTVDGAPQSDIKKLDLKVRWNFKRQREVRMVTYISRGGIKK